jgi:Na+/H+-dicarboxylate symporter
MARRWLTTAIVVAIVAGIVVGWSCNALLDPAGRQAVSSDLTLVTEIFLRLIRMIIAPLVFSTLVLGVAKMDDVAAIGRVGVKTLAWFFTASLLSLVQGTVMADVLEPGRGLHLKYPVALQVGAIATPFDAKDFIVHLVPQSIFEAMAGNEILQIVIFSLFVGAAALTLGERAKTAIALVGQIADITLKMTEFVMLTAPIAVFAALASTISVQGPTVLATLARLVGGFYLALGVLCVFLSTALFVVVQRRTGALLAAIREPLLIAFGTASSEAAYPKLLMQLECFGVSNRVASFVLPLGYSFNMDGAMMYCTFAVLFVAQAYDIELSWAEKLPMLALLMVSTKGLAGVPRASLVVIASTLQFFHLPAAGLALILTVDHLLDMGRTGMNVIGNSVAACAIAQWEGQLSSDAVSPADAETA